MSITSLTDRLSGSRFFPLALLFSFFAIGILLISTAPGTCDEGDSITHYQYARFAPRHPELFFHHWAKPFFVLLACPFAQFGFHAMKLFNLLLAAGSMWCAYQIARSLSIKRSYLTMFFLALSPAWIVQTLSGLTEPMFAFILTASVLLYLRDKIGWALLLVSFLPFVRSEGLIICGVFGVLLLFEKKFWHIPLLAVGHLVYSVAGFSTHHSLLWIFTKIPYAKMSSVYGTGSWEHFFKNMPFVIGLPLYVLLAAGVWVLLRKLFVKKFMAENMREIFLIYGCAFGYLGAHVAFWALGVFNSFGLLRVLVGVLPLFAIIQLRGFNVVDSWSLNIGRKIAASIVVTLIFLYPFCSAKYGWNYKQHFGLTTGQLQIAKAADVIRGYPDYQKAIFYYDASYLSLLFDLDPFDENVSRPVWKVWGKPEVRPEFVLWDDWFSAFEMNMELKSVEGNPRFGRVQEFLDRDDWGREKKLVLFKNR